MESNEPPQPDGSNAAWAYLAALGLFLLVLFWATCWSGRENRRILQVGIDAVARVKDIRPTGNLYNDQPEVRISVEVTADGGEPFEAEITTYLSPVYLPRFQPGAFAQVRFDPHDRRKVALVEP